jgi:hypothetical protein
VKLQSTNNQAALVESETKLIQAQVDHINFLQKKGDAATFKKGDAVEQFLPDFTTDAGKKKFQFAPDGRTAQLETDKTKCNIGPTDPANGLKYQNIIVPGAAQ